MTASFFAALAATPMLAVSMPFMHTQGNADAKVDAKTNVKASILKNHLRRTDCREVKLDLMMKQNAEIKAYLKTHVITNRNEFKAFVAFRKDVNVKYKALVKAAVEKCKAEHRSSTSSASSVSSQASTTSSVNNTSSVTSNTSTTSSNASAGASVSAGINASVNLQ